MKFEDLRAPEECASIRIRIPREHRALLHFHLEASDGFGYLAQDEAPDIGIVLTPPGLEDQMRHWLRALQTELRIELL